MSSTSLAGPTKYPWRGSETLPYTDVIVAFLVPDDNLNLHGSGGAFNDNLQSSIQTLQNAGKNVLISLGGGAGFPSSAYESYAQNVNGLVEQLVGFVTSNGFNGVDIDYEDDAGFTGTYDGTGFLIALTNGLAQALPSGQNIITHSPQTPYWDPNYNNAPYAEIWQGVGNQITWINNQFYNNPPWDATPDLKVEWYDKIRLHYRRAKADGGCTCRCCRCGRRIHPSRPNDQPGYHATERRLGLRIWRCHGLGVCQRPTWHLGGRNLARTRRPGTTFLTR